MESLGKELINHCIFGNYPKVKTLLTRSQQEIQSFINFCNGRCTALSSACVNRDSRIVKLLIRAGVDPNIPDIYGNSPLVIACRSGDAVLVSLLINCGANLEAKNSGGETCLIVATQYENSAIIQILMDHGADLGVCDVFGNFVADLVYENVHRHYYVSQIWYRLYEEMLLQGAPSKFDPYVIKSSFGGTR